MTARERAETIVFQLEQYLAQRENGNPRYRTTARGFLVLALEMMIEECRKENGS